jgi:hypothetical protein
VVWFQLSPEASASGSKAKEAVGAADTARSTRRSGAVRNLEVDLLAAADSGVGSESNGDSRDSLDHNNSNRAGAAANSVSLKAALDQLF